MVSLGMIGGFVLIDSPSLQAEGKESKTVAARKKLMKTAVKAGMGDMKKGMKAGDSAKMLKGADMLVDAAAKIPDAFNNKDLSGKTRSMASIWDKKSEFDGIAKSLGTSAKAFAVAVKTGNKEQIGSALKAVGSNCGKCHKMFRKKKKKK